MDGIDSHPVGAFAVFFTVINEKAFFRFNPGGLLSSSIEVSDIFLEDSVVVSVRGRASREQVFRTRTKDLLDGAPLVVLVNRASASASEIVAGAITDNKRGLLIGETTYGKGSVQSILSLEGTGGRLKLTTARYYTPSGVSIEKVDGKGGVKPDIEIPLTDEQTVRLAVKLAQIAERPNGPEDGEEKPEPTEEPKQPAEGTPAEGEAEQEPFHDVQLERATDILTGILIQAERSRPVAIAVD